jgi:hypothetical protein
VNHQVHLRLTLRNGHPDPLWIDSTKFASGNRSPAQEDEDGGKGCANDPSCSFHLSRLNSHQARLTSKLATKQLARGK